MFEPWLLEQLTIGQAPEIKKIREVLVMEYVSEHPGATASDIALALDCPVQRIYCCTKRLKDYGRIVNRGGKGATDWHPTEACG